MRAAPRRGTGPARGSRSTPGLGHCPAQPRTTLLRAPGVPGRAGDSPFLSTAWGFPAGGLTFSLDFAEMLEYFLVEWVLPRPDLQYSSKGRFGCLRGAPCPAGPSFPSGLPLLSSPGAPAPLPLPRITPDAHPSPTPTPPCPGLGSGTHLQEGSQHGQPIRLGHRRLEAVVPGVVVDHVELEGNTQDGHTEEVHTPTRLPGHSKGWERHTAMLSIPARGKCAGGMERTRANG